MLDDASTRRKDRYVELEYPEEDVGVAFVLGAVHLSLTRGLR